MYPEFCDLLTRKSIYFGNAGLEKKNMIHFYHHINIYVDYNVINTHEIAVHKSQLCFFTSKFICLVYKFFTYK